MGELNQSFLDINFIEMLKYFLISIILLWDGAFALKYTEKRSVTSSTGKTFECFYTIVYTKEKLDKKKSKVECTPNTNGGIAIETFDLPDFGSAQVDTKIVKGKDKITILKKVDPPTSEPAGGLLGCTCRMPNPLVEMGTAPIAGRSLRKLENHLSKVTMRRDPESNKSELTPVAPLQPTNRLFIIKLLILAALIPTITTAITNALAAIGIGRSLPINVASEVEERKENLETVLNQLQSAERKFNNALGDHAEDRTFLISLIRDAIRNAIIAQIQAFLASLIPAGRSLNVEDRQFLLQQLLNQQQGGSTDGGSPLGSLLGGSTDGGSPLGSLLGGSTGGGSPLGSLLGGSTGGSTDGGSPLGSLLGGSTGGGSPLGSLLGGSTGGGSPLGSLLGGSGSGGIVEQIIQQQMEAQMEAMLAEIIGSNGGMEEIMSLMGINGGLEEIMSLAGMNGGMEEIMSGLAGEMEGMMTEMEGMMTEMEGGMEQFMNEMMTEMGMNGGMEEMMNELMAEMGGEMPEYIDLPPLQCDCVPSDEATTTLAG